MAGLIVARASASERLRSSKSQSMLAEGMVPKMLRSFARYPDACMQSGLSEHGGRVIRKYRNWVDTHR